MEPIICLAVIIILVALIIGITALIILRNTRDDPSNENGFVWLVISLFTLGIAGTVTIVAAFHKDQYCRLPISGKRVKLNIN